MPDIDLNFSGDYQAKPITIRKYCLAKTMFTVPERLVQSPTKQYGYVKGYERDNNLQFRSAEVDRLAKALLESNGQPASIQGDHRYSRLYGCL